jgi:hypothetical protein
MAPRRAVLLACLVGAACSKNRPSVEVIALESRVAHLEEVLAQREEALKFLDYAYQQKVEAETRPVPGTVYGVDIQPDLALGQALGSPAALVTIVEAWDFG